MPLRSLETEPRSARHDLTFWYKNVNFEFGESVPKKELHMSTGIVVLRAGCEYYSVRGVVVDQVVRNSWWRRVIRKLPVTNTNIRINAAQLTALNAIGRNMFDRIGRKIERIGPVIETFLSEEQQKEYQLYSEVGITFRYAPPEMRRAYGSNRPLEVVRIKPMGPGEHLINELKVFV